ncbi:MAG: hypothetical protein A3K19_03310 [Lentisphaerae bacterium RIFOXYB12_FULL_65_16]|nr:MAG: hypothetical protein A3K18_33105 [Lentisphaerae bacterium RIFOXYA12_64_32]OGV92204.1 MAG: hypothetical protein A3K19_03310 [Lentisphaerae bacterium RIFOXYB12_FULL_65_16]
MVELLQRIRNGTYDVCRMELTKYNDRQTARPDPWVALKRELADDPGKPVADASRKADGFGPFLLKTAGTRMLDSLAQSGQQRDLAALCAKLEAILDEARMAGMLFAVNAGNAGMPWGGVDFLHPQQAGCLTVRLGALALGAEDLKAELPDLDSSLPVPAMLPFDDGRALFVIGPDAMRKMAIDSLHCVALRLLLAVPPGLLRVSVLDPLGFSLGQPPWSHWPEAVCTDPQKIEDRVSGVFAQMERLAVEKLQGHATLSAFNAWATPHGEPTIPYHVLIVHDCPSALSPTAAQKLHGIARNGGRYGIVALIHWGESIDGYAQSKLNAMAAGSVVVVPDTSGQFQWKEEAFADCRLELDALPPPDVMRRIVLPVVEAWQAQSAKTVNFEEALKDIGQGGAWKESSATGVRAPLGVAETGKLVHLEFGEGKGTHGLIIGGTGSGKSSLMHVIITALAETYSPDELQLYLIDLKGGVEFKRYATSRLPHVAVVAIDCEREFAVSALEALCAEMRRRMELYRASTADITSIAMYRKAGGSLPRILLVMDEFQKLFAEGDDIAERAKSALDGLLKEGRGFGIHGLLGTQSLKGVTLRGGSLEQIAVRVVLQCSAEDSRDALAQDNAAAKTLPRYHGIYNDQQGQKSANIQFKAAYLPPEENGIRLSALATRSSDIKRHAVVFEGNAKPAIGTCLPYAEMTARGRWLERGAASRLWLGEPVSIQPSVEVLLESQRGRSLLTIMQNPDEGISMLLNSLLALFVQHKPGNGSFTILNLLKATHQMRDWPEKICPMFDHQIEVFNPEGVGSMLSALVDELKSRMQSPALCVPHFAVVIGLQYARELRAKETYGEPDINSPAGALLYLLKEGPEHGLHILAWCDMLSNVTRCGRGLLDEFGVRVAGKMEQSDSMNVFGSPVGARLRCANRAVLFDDASPGVVQVFRPYDLPAFSDFESLSVRLREGR